MCNKDFLLCFHVCGTVTIWTVREAGSTDNDRHRQELGLSIARYKGVFLCCTVWVIGAASPAEIIDSVGQELKKCAIIVVARSKSKFMCVGHR